MNISIKTVNDDFIELNNVDSIKERNIDCDRVLECLGMYIETDNIYALSVHVNGCYVSEYNRHFLIRVESCSYIKMHIEANK